MKLTRLLIAAVIMAGLGGVVWWSNKQEAAKAGKPSPDASPKILELPDIREVTIAHREGDPTVLKKGTDGKWTITAPKPLAADQTAVTTFLGAVSPLASDRVVDPNATDLASYGLAPALVTLKFTTGDGKATTLLVGEDSAAGGSTYAKLEGDPRLFTMSSSSKTSLDKTYKDLRDKKLMNFDKDKTSRVELDVAKQPPIEFGRISENEWQILKPKPMRADGFQVDDLVTKVHDAEMNASLTDEDAKKYASSFASGQLAAVVTATDPGGTQKLEVHKSGEDYYAKSSVVEGFHKLSAEVGKALDKKVDDFRTKKIFDFGFNDPTRIEIKDGAKTSAYEKSGDNWVSNGKTMDSVSVQAAIDKLRELSAAKFVDTGFTTPAIELTVVSNGGKKTEHVQIAAAGKDFIAKREGDQTLYQLDAGPVDELRRAAGDIKEPVKETAPEKKKK